MKKTISITALFLAGMLLFAPGAFSFFGDKFETLAPENGFIKIPVGDIDDGDAHYFKVMADDGVMVSFFTLKSRDGVIRAAVDACDVCYKAGKGYVQDGDFMVCSNCGQRFASNRINLVKGGCNPAPLNRNVEKGFLWISMADVNKNSWYCKFKEQ